MFPGTRYAKAESLALAECNASKFKLIGNEKLNSNVRLKLNPWKLHGDFAYTVTFCFRSEATDYKSRRVPSMNT